MPSALKGRLVALWGHSPIDDSLNPSATAAFMR